MQNGYEVTVNNSTRMLGERDIAVIFPGEVHSTRSNGLKKALVLQFPPAAVKTVYEISQRWGVFTSKRVISEDEEPGLLALLSPILNDIIRVRQTQPVFKEAEYYALLLTFFSALGRYRLSRERCEDGCGTNNNNTEKLAEACSYIIENCAVPLTLEEISRRVGFSKFHFSRLFRKYTDMSLSEFIADVRIRKVEQLLSDDKAKISDIALEAGFCSLSAFNRAFKKNKGVSPSEFRNMYD
ncbi:hypothetical protein FACS189490_07690 [Clostridia bacterium]|nr:hypothetical protein FACS189490_07690 [Clostridia bacterium]